MLLPLLLTTAFAGSWELWDAAPRVDADPVLVITTPGFGLQAFLPLVDALVQQGRDVQVLKFACRGQDAAAYADAIAEAAATLPPGLPVVAHGVGASLALLAAERVKPRRLVLLAPVLAVQPVAVTSWLAGLDVGPSVDLSTPAEWKGRDVSTLLLGPGAHMGCVSADFAREVQGWVRAGAVPLPLERVTAPVWLAVSLGDDLATVEAAVPASRRLPQRELVRLGINRLDPKDFSHGEMLWHAVPVSAAVHAAAH